MFSFSLSTLSLSFSLFALSFSLSSFSCSLLISPLSTPKLVATASMAWIRAVTAAAATWLAVGMLDWLGRTPPVFLQSGGVMARPTLRS